MAIRKRKMNEAPRFLTPKDALDSKYFPEKVEIPKEYFPNKVGPGSFDPQLMYAHAAAIRNSSVGGMIPYETKAWVILWLLDHVDWEGIDFASYCPRCGRDKHGYQGSLCRYCDPEAYSE